MNECGTWRCRLCRRQTVKQLTRFRTELQCKKTAVSETDGDVLTCDRRVSTAPGLPGWVTAHAPWHLLYTSQPTGPVWMDALQDPWMHNTTRSTETAATVTHRQKALVTLILQCNQKDQEDWWSWKCWGKMCFEGKQNHNAINLCSFMQIYFFPLILGRNVFFMRRIYTFLNEHYANTGSWQVRCMDTAQKITCVLYVT